MFSSCIGSFQLSKNLLEWNKSVGDKFVNEVVFIAMNIVPVYSVCIFVDALVINSIEFWTNENPLQAGVVTKVEGANGNYTVETLENGYNIKNENKEEVNLIYNKTDNTWNVEADGESVKLIQIEDENSAIVFLPGGETQRVDLSANGVLAFRQVVENAGLFAAR